MVDHDYVVVGAQPDDLLALGYKPVGKDFPVFLHPRTGEEYALARTERKSGHGYHGFEFHADASVTLEQDLARRDLTINAIAEDAEGVLTDPHRRRGRYRTPACCAMCRRPSSRILFACCGWRASPPASPRWVFAWLMKR